MFTVFVYRFLADSSLDLIRRIPNVLSVDFKDGFFSVFVFSSDGEPDVILVEPYYFLACCHGSLFSSCHSL